jgi:hypothetical protein
MTAANLHLVCIDCQRPFVFYLKQQVLFARHGWQVPRRCEACRAINRATRARRDAEPERA